LLEVNRLDRLCWLAS